jgi:sialidase-1
MQNQISLVRILSTFVSVVLFSQNCAGQSFDFESNPIPLRMDRENHTIAFLTIDSDRKMESVTLRLDGQQWVSRIVVFELDKGLSSISPNAKPISECLNPKNVVTLDTSSSSKNRFAVGLSFVDDVNLLSRVSVAFSGITIDGKTQSVEDAGTTFRPSVKLRDTGDGDSKGYRIPGLVRTNAGTLLACYDIRYEGRRDLQGHMDIGISRSINQGESWERMRIALDMGEYGGLPQKYNGVSDACLLVDEKTDRVFCFGLWMHGVNDKSGKWSGREGWIHQWHHNGSLPGFEIKGTSQFIMSFTDDDGQTWSPPKNLTKMVKRNPKWYLFAPAPGNGIMMKDGTLVVPVQGKDQRQRAFSTIMVSHDRGQTWKTGMPANRTSDDRYANECAVVELPNGTLMLNARDPSGKKFRGVFVTQDLGETWTNHPSDHKALVEPTCMASLIKIDKDGKPVLLFSNPNTQTSRERMTVKASLDNGATWPTQYQLLLDKLGGAYSSLAQVDSETVGIVYESSQAQLLYQRLRIDEIFGMDDVSPKNSNDEGSSDEGSNERP